MSFVFIGLFVGEVMRFLKLSSEERVSKSFCFDFVVFIVVLNF